MANTEPVGLPSSAVWKLAGIPASTLNYWVQIKLVHPSHRGPQGKRVEYWWSVEDVVIVRTIRALRQAGITLQQVRRVRRTLESWGQSFADSRLIWDGHEVHVLGPDGDIAAALHYPGQRVLQLTGLPIGEWHKDAAARAVPVPLEEFRVRAKQRRRMQLARAESLERFVHDNRG